MSNINEFPIDDSLKEMIANIVANELVRINISMTENERLWFKNECAGNLVENVLDSITEWEKQKLN